MARCRQVLRCKGKLSDVIRELMLVDVRGAAVHEGKANSVDSSFLRPGAAAKKTT